MSATFPESSLPAPGASNWRARLLIVVIGVAMTAGVGGFWAYSMQATQQHEQRVIAGDFPDLQVVTEKGQIEDGGKVLPDALSPSQEHPRYVASTRLIPSGRYQALLLAHDGNAEHLEKAEMVIAMRDEQGQWHPETAPQVLARMKGHGGQAR
jgi:hypothetical protein